jgi:hypothetical protein
MMELHRGTFDVVVDGKIVGSIDMHDTMEAPVEPGRHTLQVREGRYSSRDVAFDVTNGDVVTFRCNGARIWPIYLASIVKPDLALKLKHE